LLIGDVILYFSFIEYSIALSLLFHYRLLTLISDHTSTRKQQRNLFGFRVKLHLLLAYLSNHSKVEASNSDLLWGWIRFSCRVYSLPCRQKRTCWLFFALSL